MARFLSAGALALILAWSGSFADTILLKNGKRLEGTITYQDAEVVHLASGPKTQIVRKSQIKRMTYSPPPAAESQMQRSNPEDREAQARAEKEKERKLNEQREAERKRAQIAEAKRREEARLKKEREEKQKQEAIAAEKKRQEQERMAREESERAQKEKLAREEEEKLARERAAAERARQEQIEKEREEKERIAADEKRKEQERIAEERRTAEEKKEADRRAEEQRILAEKQAEEARLAEEQRRVEAEKQAAVERLMNPNYLRIGASYLRGTDTQSAAGAALYNLQSYSLFTGGYGFRDRYAKGNDPAGLLKNAGTDHAASSANPSSVFEPDAQKGGRLQLLYGTGRWRFSLDAERLRNHSISRIEYGTGLSGPFSAFTAATYTALSEAAESRTGGRLRADYSVYRSNLLDFFLSGGYISKSLNVSGQTIQNSVAGPQSGPAILADEEAKSKSRGGTAGFGVQFGPEHIGGIIRLEGYSMKSSLSAKALGAGRFFTFTPGNGGQPAFPSIEQSGREKGASITAGMYWKFYERYFLLCDLTIDSARFYPTSTKTFGLDYSTDPFDAGAAALFPGLYTGNRVIAAEPVRILSSSLSLGLGVRMDFSR